MKIHIQEKRSSMLRILAFSSRTGSDILYLDKFFTEESIYNTAKCEIVGIVTNNPTSPLLTDFSKEKYVLPSQPTLQDYQKYVEKWRKMSDIIILSGYLRVLPPELCSMFEIYNAHPGDIVQHPELKGLDPQKKAIELRLTTTGVVIHEVTLEIDSGKIIARLVSPIRTEDTEESLS